MEIDADACYRAVLARDGRFDGRFYTAVRTTGIYCRPICPAPTPKRSNVQFYASAAAAQAAGFRPCLRCRPERAPTAGEISHRPDLLQRALKLIELGWLDGGSVAQLAAQLAIGERQLRRLFDRHLGAAPIQVAQSRRLLLAKQLIQDTPLPMTEIAFAAGFGSLRRFNEAFLAGYQVAPAHWRRELRTGVRMASVGRDSSSAGLSLRLYYRPPLDWPALQRFFATRAIAGIETIGPRGWWRALQIGAIPVVVAIRAGGPDHLQVELHSDSLAILPTLLSRLRRVFDLGADPLAVTNALGSDAQLAPLLTGRQGLRVPGGWGGFELAVRALLGQQISVPAALRLVGLLVERLGSALPPQLARVSGLRCCFPTPERVAEADLDFLPMPRARRLALRALAQAVSDRPALLQPGPGLSAALEALQSIAGVGPWTAHYIALRELREPDAFPASDVGLLRAWQALAGERPSPAELGQRAERWRPWRAYAAQLLWDSIA